MGDHDLDFDADELAMLRQLFRTEAHEALETVTTRVLAAGSARPSPDALTEMMRVTHTLKGAAGTVGLTAMVELSHRLESALAVIARDGHQPWTSSAADLLVEIADGLRAYLDFPGNPDDAAVVIARLHAQIDQVARAHVPDAPPPPPPEAVLPRAAADAVDTAVAEPKAYLRVEPDRIDALMSSAGELLFDRTRIERRVQLLRTLSRDLARTRQGLRDALAADPVTGDEPTTVPRAVLASAESELASQGTLLSQTTAALLDEIEALRRTIGELQRGLTRIRMDTARNLMLAAARTLRALRRRTGVRVELRTIGEDTEFDKAVAEQLVDPLTQLLRNAVALGRQAGDGDDHDPRPPGRQSLAARGLR